MMLFRLLHNVFISQKSKSRPFTHALQVFIITPRQRKITHCPTGSVFFLFEHLCQSKKVSLDLLLMPSTFLSSLSGRGKLLIPQQAVKICFHENLFPHKQKRAWNYVGTVEPVLCSVNKKKNHSVKQVKWRFFKK